MKTRFKIVLLLSLATLSLNAQGIQIGYIHPDYVSKRIYDCFRNRTIE